jgi:four helix bundle protein
MNVKKFEDLECWQKSRELCKYIFQLSRKDQFIRDYKHVDQINGSAGSSMDNIAEGFGRRGNREFAYFLHVSLGSIYEVKSQLYRASDKNYISSIEFNEAMNLADVSASKVYNLIRTIEKSDYKGYKYM